MLKTNCSFLDNEILDVVRMFERRPAEISHTFRKEQDVFYNDFVVDGREYFFQDVGECGDEIALKRLERRFAKLALYKILSSQYGERMPWGALTGIRPTKLAYGEWEQGRDFKPLFEKMEVSAENIRLVGEILESQKGIYERKDHNTDYFVSIPFCPTKCVYCSFITAPIDKTKGFLSAYLDCLEREIYASKPLIGNLRSVYVGGGTPFALDRTDLERVLKSLAYIYDGKCEYTVEAGRPDVFSEEKLALLKEYGVTRICINPQTFHDETLQKIGRKHTVKQLYEAFEMAKKYHFDINLDLIAGLEGEGTDEFSYSVKKAVETGAENITVHCLSLKSGAKLKEDCSYIKNPVVSNMVPLSRSILRESGYEPYYMYRQKYQVGNNENVGWTKKGKACVYNVDIMEEISDNLAVGANAVSKRVFTAENKIERLGAQKDLRTYIENVELLIKKKEKFFK